MENEPRRRCIRADKASKKGGKTLKAKSAEEEARRREALKETLVEKLEFERRALQVVERLLEDSVTDDFLVDCAKFITPANYKDAVEERSIVKLCGYPLCPNKLGKLPTQQFKISTKTNKVYDISERKCFCSNFCYKASKEFELKISNTPLWLRHHESPPDITLMKEGVGGSSGEEVRIAERRLQPEDIENPVAVNPGDLPHPGSHPLSASHSDDSDGDQEQDFVSSVVSQRPVSRVHWADPPTEMNQGGGQKEKRQEDVGEEGDDQNGEMHGEHMAKEGGGQRGGSGGETVLCKAERVADAERRTEADAAETDRPSGRQQMEEKSALSGHAAEDSCGVARQPNAAAEGARGKRQSDHATRVNDSNDAGSGPGTRLMPRPDPTTLTEPRPPGVTVTRVGMSRRGAAALLELLERHAATPGSVRQSLLESLERTLKEWCSDGTKAFLHGPDRSSGLAPSGVPEEKEQEEEELDEDDLEEEVVVVREAGGGGVVDGPPGEQERPVAAVPDYHMLQRQTQELELRVQEFYKGIWILPEEDERQAGDSQLLQATSQNQAGKDPVLPLIDSQAQTVIRKRITLEKLTRSLRNIVGPLGLTMSDISTDLTNLVRTFRFTNTNIIHKTPEWTLIAVVLLHLLTEVSAVVQEALRSPASVEYVNTLMHEISLQQHDLQTLVQLFKFSVH